MAVAAVDRTRVIERAHYYYALAILNLSFTADGTDMFRETILEAYTGENEDEAWNLLPSVLLFDRALAWLHDNGLVELVEDDFGPPVIKQSWDFLENWRRLVLDESLPFSRYEKLTKGDRWLRSALDSLNASVEELGLTDLDFERPDSDWAPIPLEPSEPELRKILDNLDETVEQVRGANGYAEAAQEERKFVLDSLSNAAASLRKGGTTSLGFLRRQVTDPLGILVKRFGDALLGAVARATIEGLKAWLKLKGWHF